MEEFKTFKETYTIITFTLSTSFIYPNPRTDMYRLIAIPIVVLSITPLASMIFIDMYFSWLEGDYINIIRHSTVVGPFLGGLFKMVLIYHKRRQAKQILDEIDDDYIYYNQLPEDYQQIARQAIRNCQIYSERCWVVVVMFCVMTFPVMATVQNTYNFLFASEPAKYMVHDMNLPFMEKETRFQSPYFELLYLYMLYASGIYVINFIGYDGFFGLSINHACLKMDIFCKKLEDALKRGGDTKLIAEVIREQCRMFDFVDIIQDTFNIWLGLIFLATMIQICTCLYQITEGYGFDLRYMIFVVGATIHIYLPCRYSAKLKALSAETSNKIYCSGWESVADPRVWRMVMFMVARAQPGLEIRAFQMMTFDMELFVSIMQTSYSMFTLLRS